MLHDAFICHASEDKDSLVRPLAERLREEHVDVWFDEFSVQVGDSLRRTIDKGLAQSRFGIVVISPDFFGKQWPQWELDGLVVRQNSERRGVILPVWHGVDEAEVRHFSPSLADKRAANSRDGLEKVVQQLVAAIHPQGSTLVIARDHLLDWGCEPPVVTDDWWLDVAALADANFVEGTFQEPTGWGRWGFPLPPPSADPEERGWRLACAAMQMSWQAEAQRRPITQLTEPQIVHEFIASQPGLKETCHDYLPYLISYAPQIVIPGYGGDLEDAIEAEYQRSLSHAEEMRRHSPNSGIALTIDGNPPRCDEEVALRDPGFGGYEAGHIACNFVQGDVMGPDVRVYDYVDYLAWFLSEASSWLPREVRDVLRSGMASWGVWLWREHERAYEGFVPSPSTGHFAKQLERAKTRPDFQPDSEALADIRHRLAFSSALLNLPESGDALANCILETDVLDLFFEARKQQATKRATAGP